MEELQRNSSVNHGLVTEQEVEQKSKELRTLGETLTDLKSEWVVLEFSKDDADLEDLDSISLVYIPPNYFMSVLFLQILNIKMSPL